MMTLFPHTSEAIKESTVDPIASLSPSPTLEVASKLFFSYSHSYGIIVASNSTAGTPESPYAANRDLPSRALLHLGLMPPVLGLCVHIAASSLRADVIFYFKERF